MNNLPSSPTEVIYPDSDPDAMPEYPPHMMAVVMLLALLRDHFRASPDVYVIGDVFWYYQEGNPQARKAPDVMVIKGVDPRTQRHSFKSWEHNTGPCFILEVLSDATASEDKDEKVRLYERLGVREYFLFDPEGGNQERPLVGYRLIRGKYEELQPGADGTLPSSELALFLRPDGDQVALISMRTRERLPFLPEMRQQMEELSEELQESRRLAEQAQAVVAQERQRAEQERQRAEQEKLAKEQERQRAEQARQAMEEVRQHADQERQRAEEERRRADELAAEVARLRALLSPPSSPGAGGAGN